MIQLTKNIWMTADERQYIIGKLGKDRLKSQRYYTDITLAVKDAISWELRMSVADEKITTLQQFIDEQERLTVEIQTALSPLNADERRLTPTRPTEQG